MKITKESKIWIIVGITILFIFNVMGLNRMLVPTILHDEVGYWASAAYFAGYDWSGITSVFSYYSYGIGLIFAIFIKLTSNMILVYRMVMGLNVILLLLMFLMSYKICEILFEYIPRNIKVMSSVISLCYPTYMMNIGIAWSEYYILFMVWLNIFLFVLLIKKPTILKMIFYGISIGYTYMIHQRNIGIIFVGIGALTFLMIGKKLSIRNYFFSIITIVIMLVFHKCIKNNIIQNLWDIDETAKVLNRANDYSGRFNNMIYAFENAGIKSIIRSALGKLYYLIIASGGVYIISAIMGLHAVKRLIKYKTGSIQDISVIYIHMIVFCLFIISTIASMEDGLTVARIDGLIYGRYIECAVGPLLMIGMIEFYQCQYSHKMYFCVIAFVLSVSLIIVNIYRTGSFDVFLASCAGGVYLYYDFAGAYNFIFLGATVIVCILTGIFLLKKSGKEILIFLAFLIILIVYGVNGRYLQKNSRNKVQNNNQTMIEFAEHVNDVQEKVPIYCVRGNLPYAYMSLEVVQYLLPDYVMSYLEIDELPQLSEEFYLLVETSETVDMDRYVQIDTVANGWLVMVRKDSDLYEKVIEKWR